MGIRSDRIQCEPHEMKLQMDGIPMNFSCALLICSFISCDSHCSLILYLLPILRVIPGINGPTKFDWPGPFMDFMKLYGPKFFEKFKK